MNSAEQLALLHRLTGRLQAAAGAPDGELDRFERTLAQRLRNDPALHITGNRLAHEAAEAPDASDAAFAQRVRDLDAWSARAPATSAPVAPTQVFRRETDFRSPLLGNSVPAWGSGMAPAATFGPFVDEHGLRVWFDLFTPTRLVSVYLAGHAAPALRVPIFGTLTGRTSYRIEAGSAWIASDLIARVPALAGRYTGLRIAGGSLTLPQAVTVSHDSIIVPAAAAASLHLDLDPPTPPGGPRTAGIDAAEASVRLPATFDLTFHQHASQVHAAAAKCTVFGCEVSFRPKAGAPAWLAPIGQILVPYAAKTHADSPDRFAIATSKSALCTVEGEAPIDPALTGWLLPAAQVDASHLGQAAGTGALCIALGKGLRANWRDLARAKTMLQHPGIVAEPGLVTVLDFTAANANGRQRWTLWRHPTTPHHAEVTLTFGKAFPFAFVTSAADSEGVFFFCGLDARLDRPLDANGTPFPVRSAVGFAATLQAGPAFHALLVDTDLPDTSLGAPAGTAHFSLALRNAFFTVSPPRSLALFGVLERGRITRGTLALTHAILRYLPTLPDPYAASYVHTVRETMARGLGGTQQALTGIVRWPDLAPLAHDAPQPDDPRALVHYRLTPVDPYAVRAGEHRPAAERNFLTGLATFDQVLPVHAAAATLLDTPDAPAFAATAPARGGDAGARVAQALRSGALDRITTDLAAHPALARLDSARSQVGAVLETALRASNAAPQAVMMATTDGANAPAYATTGRGALGADMLMLLDVSSRADQMGVTLGPAIVVGRDERGATLETAGTTLFGTGAGNAAPPLQIINMDVVATARNVRAATLPQISWEPFWNIPLPIEGGPDPTDTITVTPGLVVHGNDGIPTRIFSESPYPVPIAPLPVTRHVLREFNDAHTPRQAYSAFNLPFGMVAFAQFNRQHSSPPDENARLDFNMPHFGELRGGLQIKARPPASKLPAKVSPSFKGWTIQLDDLRWSLFGLPLAGSTLGRTVRDVFNLHFRQNKPSVPLERMELSGYGASIFSDYRDATATIADVSQAQFDVVVGRTAHEVVQIRSILYPFGVHVVRTITLMRSNNGYVFRSDSGWKAESDGFYDFGYTLVLGTLEKPIANPYLFHAQPVKGVSNVREIRDFPDGGAFDASFALDDPALPPEFKSIAPADWEKVFKGASAPGFRLGVHMQCVVFDADVHVDNVVGGGTGQGAASVVQSRRMLGYVQLAPSSILVPDRIFADLLRFQNGSLGGPVDCTIDVAKSGQRMRLSRVDVNPARNASGRDVFVTAARGSLVLPKDGAWSVLQQRTDTGDVKPVPPQDTVPLVKPNASPNFQVAHPADAEVQSSGVHYGVVQSTGTQKLLFDVPQFTPGDAKLKSAQTYFADAYKLLNSKGPFPNIANALALTAAEREVAILGEGLMKMAERTLDLSTLLPASYVYPFIDEPDVLRIYAEYKSTTNASGLLTLGLDSKAAPDKQWKAALANLRVVVDLGPFKELMWIDGNFNAASSISTKYDKPHLQFGPVLDPVVQILQVLATLSGEDFDRGMSVGMSNAADNWEYKFDCAKEIPVIKFPSPLQLTLNPNPPLKLEAGLKVGFYFNEVISVPTDVKQLVPACGAYVEFYGRLQVQCFTLAIASVYAVGQVTLGIAADSKAGITLHMKFGFGAEIVVGLPVVANVAVLYMVEVEVSIADSNLHVAGLLLFRGSAEILGGLIGIAIQIEAGGGVDRVGDETTLTAQVTFSIDVCVLWVIDIDVTEHWEEKRQIA